MDILEKLKELGFDIPAEKRRTSTNISEKTTNQKPKLMV